MKTNVIGLGLLLVLSGLMVQMGCGGVWGEAAVPGANDQGNSLVQAESSKLPARMPETVKMSYYKGDGRVIRSTTISIEGDQLSYKQTTGPERNDQNWTKKITPADKAALYKAFVDNKFDLIKNDPGSQANDTPSESIWLSLDTDKATQVTWDPIRSPLSGVSRKRFEAVRQALLDLAEKYKK